MPHTNVLTGCVLTLMAVHTWGLDGLPSWLRGGWHVDWPEHLQSDPIYRLQTKNNIQSGFPQPSKRPN